MNLRSLSRRFFSRVASRPAPLRSNPLGRPLEALEDRSVPAILTWVGDQDANWATDNDGDTNWSGDALPASGDTLIFAGAGHRRVGILNNDTTAGNTYALQFTADGYTIDGNGITLDQTTTGTAFAIQLTTGQAAINVPLTLADTTNTIEVQLPGGPTPLVSLSGVISGAVNRALVKSGGGQLNLDSAGNTYGGATTIDGGTLLVNGVIVSDTTVNAGGTLGGNGTITGNVTGAGIVAAGASPGILVINGDFTPTGVVQFEINPPASTAGTDFDQIQVNGAVDLSGASLTFTGNPGAVAFASKRAIITNNMGDATTASTSPAEGSTVTINGNSYRIYYNSGTGGNDVRLVASGVPTVVYVDDSFVADPGDDITDADAGTTGNQEAVFGLNAFNTLADALAAVTTSGTIVVNAGTYNETISLGGTRTLRIGGPNASQAVVIDSVASIAGTTIQIDGGSAFTLGDATNVTIGGAITDTGSLTKAGTGTLTLSGTNSYTGTTTVNGGILLVNGSITSNTTVNLGGTLGGNGTITGSVTGAGAVAAGVSPGILAIVGDFTPLGDVAFEVETPATTAGTDFDQITVTGDVDLTNATLTFTGTGGAAVANQLLTIISNSGANPTVDGLPPQGSIVGIGTTNYLLFYNGGDGNDVVLVEATQPALVYVNDDWAGLNDGQLIADVDPLTAGLQPGVFGVNAFGDIAPALAAVAANGEVFVLGNDAAGYGAFTVAQAVTLTLVNDTFFGENQVTLNGTVTLDGANLEATLNHGAGTVNLRTTAAGTITGAAGTETVSIATNAANTGAVILGGVIGTVDSVALGSGGTKLNTLDIAATITTADGGIGTFTNGITTMTGSLNTDGGPIAMTAGGGVRIGASVTLDTEQGDDGDAGDVNLSAASFSASEAGTNLTIDTGSAFAGATAGGAILGGLDNAGGHSIVNVTVDADATTRGNITFGGAATISGDLDATGKNIASNATFTAGGLAANTIDLDATGTITDGNAAAVNFAVPLGNLSINYTTGVVEADTTVTDFFALGDGNLTIRETNAINLQGVNFGATRVFDLTTGAAGTVTQDQPVVGGGLRLITGAGATVTLDDAANDLVTLAANVNGTTFINDLNALRIGTVVGKTATTDGVNTNGNTLTLVTGDLLTIGDATGGTDDITAAGSTVDLFTNAGGVLEANGAAITAANLRVAGTGTQFELASVNTVAVFAANTTGGPLRFNNGATNLQLGSVTLNAVTTDGVTTDNANATIAAGALSVAEVLDVGTGTARLTTQGGVTQADVITAGSLGVNNSVGGAVDLDGASNKVDTFAATTTAGGIDFLNGIALEIGAAAADGPLFGIPVDGLATQGGAINLQTINGGSTLAVNSPIGSAGGDITVNTSAGQTLNANVAAAAGDVSLTAVAGGIDQTGGGVSGTDLDLFGAGTFNLNGTNDATGVFGAGVAGGLTFRDTTDLAIRDAANAVGTAGGNLLLYAGEDLNVVTGTADRVLLNAGAGTIRLVPGAGAAAGTKSKIVVDAEAIGSSGTIGVNPTGTPNENNSGSNDVTVVPSANLTWVVFGNNPKLADIAPGVEGDSFTPKLTNPLVTGLNLVLDPDDPNTNLSGTFTITYNGQPNRQILFRQIESLGNLGYRAIVTQTGNQQYAIRLQKSVLVPVPGSITGQAIQSSPFVVSPSFVSTLSVYSAPTLAYGDVNGDGLTDLVIANGANDLPLITVIDGKALFQATPLDLGNLPPSAVLARFYAYTDAQGQPTFRGGLNVAVKSNGAGLPAEIVVGPGVGGGPVVRTFRVAGGTGIETSSFFAFEPSFRGGVTVATGNYDGVGPEDIIVGTGPGGAPRVQVFKDGNPAAQIANFFAYDENFRGGVFVASGNFNGDNMDDIAVAPGYGGGPHIRVMGNSVGGPIELASFFAWAPSASNGLQTLGTNLNNGVGSISFGAPIRIGPGVTDGNGRQEILVSSARGTPLQTRRFLFANATDRSPSTVTNLYNELTVPGTLDEFGIPIPMPIPILDPMTGLQLFEGQLFEGGSVAGFTT